LLTRFLAVAMMGMMIKDATARTMARILGSDTRRVQRVTAETTAMTTAKEKNERQQGF
jgi:hypothetical protein